jgi:DNA-directed RNA polymerase sigma subunit (sigma70/sigma32)
VTLPPIYTWAGTPPTPPGGSSHLPVHIHDLMVSIAKVERDFVMQAGRRPVPHEVAKRLGLPVSMVEVFLKTLAGHRQHGRVWLPVPEPREDGEIPVTSQEKLSSLTRVGPTTLVTKSSLRAELQGHVCA